VIFELTRLPLSISTLRTEMVKAAAQPTCNHLAVIRKPPGGADDKYMTIAEYFVLRTKL